jgi:hypothetical protein
LRLLIRPALRSARSRHRQADRHLVPSCEARPRRLFDLSGPAAHLPPVRLPLAGQRRARRCLVSRPRQDVRCAARSVPAGLRRRNADPSYPNARRRPPYHGQLLAWAHQLRREGVPLPAGKFFEINPRPRRTRPKRKIAPPPPVDDSLAMNPCSIIELDRSRYCPHHLRIAHGRATFPK